MGPRLVFLSLVWFFGFRLVPTAGDPGRDLCKIYNGGLKCSAVSSQYFPYDLFLSFNDDLVRFTHEMKFLQIESSNISVLQSRSFQSTPSLSQIILSEISLMEIEQGAFGGLNRLKLVDLSHNLLRSIPVDLFKHTKIIRLSLEGNELVVPESAPLLSAKYLNSLSLKNCSIRYLSDYTFGELPALMHLDLSHNQLNSMPLKIFYSLKHLTHLDLSHNQFTTLNINIFKSIPSFPKFPTFVILANNPWDCDCALSELSEWVTRNRVTEEWTEIPRDSRLKRTVTCFTSHKLSWNSEQFRQLMSAC
ncbi:hypothetical protein RUM44_000978 [Polyplax serrata]|uniref:Uncharacterized protein n=1 Tax=Polyplax serrata TaxID=468196 RepID=A0ABR1B955_POLSC